MLLEQLTIHNFKSFLGTHVFQLNRDPGLYYIAGRNTVEKQLGANAVGKSTIWDALTYVLFGKTGRDSRPANAIVPWELDRGTTYVELLLTIEKQEFTIRRSRNPNELSITTNDHKEIVTQEEVQRLIGMSEEMFRRTVVLGQFGSLFLDLTPEKQSQMFNEALTLDLWLRASSVASTRIKDNEKTKTNIQHMLALWEGEKGALEGNWLDEEKLANEYNQHKAVRIKELSTLIAQESAKAVKELPSGQELRLSPSMLQEQLEASRKAHRGLLAEQATAKADLRSWEAKLTSVNTALQDYRKALQGEQLCPECGQQVSKEHLREKIAEQKAAAAELDMEISDTINVQRCAQKKLLDNSNEQRELELEFSAIQKLQTKLLQLERERTQLETMTNPHVATAAKLRTKLKESKAKIADSTRQLEEVEAALETYAYWADGFKEIRLNLIDQVLEELEFAVTRHAESLGLEGWHIQFETERETKSGATSVGFTTLLFPCDAAQPIKFESYSGGESQRWQLAAAFGLSEIILGRAGVQPNIEVYDEPSKGMSPEGVEALLEHLATRAKELNRAIFVTDHHSLERGMFTSTILVERDAEGSHVIEDAPPEPVRKRRRVGTLERLTNQANIDAQKAYFTRDRGD